jgi:hypothetical protein
VPNDPTLGLVDPDQDGNPWGAGNLGPVPGGGMDVGPITVGPGQYAGPFGGPSQMPGVQGSGINAAPPPQINALPFAAPPPDPGLQGLSGRVGGLIDSASNAMYGPAATPSGAPIAAAPTPPMRQDTAAAAQNASNAPAQQVDPVTGAPIMAAEEALRQQGATASDAGSEMPQPTVVPAHVGRAVSPEVEAQLNAANAKQIEGVDVQKAGIGTQADAESEIAMAEAAGAGVESKHNAKAADRVVTERTAAARAAVNHLEELNTAYKTMATRGIDPMHYMASRPIGQKILDVLGAMFGGAATYGHGGPNQYVEHMHDLVRQDVDAQAANIRNAKDSLEAQRSLVGQIYGVTGDLDLSKRYAEGLQLQSIRDKTTESVKGLTPGVITSKAVQAGGTFDEKIGRLMGEGAETENKMRPWVQAQAVGGAGAATPFEHTDKLVTMPNGQTILANGEKQKEEIESSVKNTQKVQMLVSQALRLRQAGAPTSLEGRGQLSSVQSQLEMALKEPGVRLSGESLKLLENLTGSLTTPEWLPGGGAVNKNLAHVSSTGLDELNKFVASQNRPIVKTGFANTPTKGVIQTGRLTGQYFGNQPSGVQPGFKPTQ